MKRIFQVSLVIGSLILSTNLAYAYTDMGGSKNCNARANPGRNDNTNPTRENSKPVYGNQKQSSTDVYRRP